MSVEVELELYVQDIVIGIHIVSDPHVLGQLEVFVYLAGHVVTRADTVTSNPVFDLLQTSASSEPADQLVSYSEEDANETAAHREMVVAKRVPLWHSDDVLVGRGVNYDSIAVQLGLVALAVILAHCVMRVGN